MAIEQRTKQVVRHKASRGGAAVHKGIRTGLVHAKDVVGVGLASVFEFGRGLVTGSSSKKPS